LTTSSISITGAASPMVKTQSLKDKGDVPKILAKNGMYSIIKWSPVEMIIAKIKRGFRNSPV